MSHTRIRKFNTGAVYHGQQFDNDFCNAVVADNLVFLRGQVGMDLATNESVGVGDPTAQTEQAMSNIEMLLGEARARLEDICKLVVYVTDVRYREPVYQVIGRWLRDVYPCSTGVVVSGLARREWVVEIDVTAVIPRERMAATR